MKDSGRRSKNIEDKRTETRGLNMDRKNKPLQSNFRLSKGTRKVNAQTQANMADKSGVGATRLLRGAMNTKPGKYAQFLEPKPVQDSYRFKKAK